MSEHIPDKPVKSDPTGGPLDAFWCALMFLTRIPTPPVAHSDRLLALSAAYFPLVGLIIGGLGAITYSIALAMWNPEIAVVLTLGVMIYATGGFHEDGLADTSDGIGGGWSTEDKLQIMKDSRIGTYGSLALVLALLVKYTTLLAITPESIATALICGHVLARWSILPLLHSSHYVGSSEGSGKPLVGRSVANAQWSPALLC